jgi:hypothetical protein
MQYRENSYTVPLVKNNKLAGLLLRYDSRSQLLDAIPAPIITHFLKEAESRNYRGFPSAGFLFSQRVIRNCATSQEEKGKGGGVYVTNVEPNMPAMKGGLQVGDIVTAVANNEIDQNGNYVDPLYGKIEFTNLLTAHAYSGDVVPFRIQRSGKPMDLKVTLEHRTRKDYVSPPTISINRPRITCSAVSFFRSFPANISKNGDSNWQREAPQRLVYSTIFNQSFFQRGIAASLFSVRSFPPTAQSATMIFPI